MTWRKYAERLGRAKFARSRQGKDKRPTCPSKCSPAGLYTEKDEVDALMRGDIQLIAPAFANISERVPAWELFDLP